MNVLISDLEQWVQETLEFSESDKPEILDAHAPVLAPSVIDPRGEDDLYLVGLIGGKNVGKSSIVNALIGEDISDESSIGPGTEIAVAYVHQNQCEALRRRLDSLAPGQYRIVTHTIDELSRQVLIDLPDIDSFHENHREITRRMLRLMLYPVWVQSVEKYADRQPRDLMRRVGEGNAPENFVYCLNKIEQVDEREGSEAVEALRADCARRIARTLGLEVHPKVWLISALHPRRFEFPAFRRMLARQRPLEAVHQSARRAVETRAASLLQWIEARRLPEKLARLERLRDEAQEEVASKVGEPLLKEVIPAVADDAGHRRILAEAWMQTRVKRWPIVNVLHTAVGPLASLMSRRLRPGAASQEREARGCVAAHCHALGIPIAQSIRAAFARLQRVHPSLLEVYRDCKLWEEGPSIEAEHRLRRRLARTLESHRAAIRAQAERSGRGVFASVGRMIVTWGAALWFPIVQPIVEALLEPGKTGSLALAAVRIFGVTYLLRSALFLLIYFLCLWLLLKWDSHRRVDRWLGRRGKAKNRDPSLDLTCQAIEWMDELTLPIRARSQRLADLIGRINAVKGER